MNALETPAELRTAFDALLAATQRRLRLYDCDLSLLDLDHAPRHAALRALCVVAAGAASSCCSTTSVALHAIISPDAAAARFRHVLEIRWPTRRTAPRQAFVLADRHGVLLRADKARYTVSCSDPRQPCAASGFRRHVAARAGRRVGTTLGL